MINLGTQGRNVDFSNAPSTRPVKTGTALPGTCATGDLFFNTSAPAGQNLFGCAAPNTWALAGGERKRVSGLSDPGANGLVVRTAANTTAAVLLRPELSSVLQMHRHLQTRASTHRRSTPVRYSALAMPAFSGDISTSAGGTATSLATVNSSPGTVWRFRPLSFS